MTELIKIVMHSRTMTKMGMGLILTNMVEPIVMTQVSTSIQMPQMTMGMASMTTVMVHPMKQGIKMGMGLHLSMGIVMTMMRQSIQVQRKSTTMVSTKIVMDSRTMMLMKMEKILQTTTDWTAMILTSTSIRVRQRFGTTASIKIVTD